MKTFILPSALLVALLASAPLPVRGGEPARKQPAKASSAQANDVYAPFLINNVFNYYGNNGDGSLNKFSASNEGFEFLKGSGKTCVFEDGVLWGGYHKGRTTPKVGGSVYRHGLQAGPILQYGTATTDPIADDPTTAANRIYRVRPDINPKTPFADVQSVIASEELPFIVRYESYTDQDIYDRYIKDWNEWPAALGAPFQYGKDSNNIQRTTGPYDPRYDVPGRPGADQTLWYVANDMNAVRVTLLAGSPPIGLEMQRTIWGYRRPGPLGQTIFVGTLLINKSGAKIDSMFLAQWADPDVGDGYDDFVGCDTSRNLGYAYNGGATDAMYGVSIPAVGFDIVQGPIVQGALGDTAVFHMTKRPGYRNLPMSAFVFFTQGNLTFRDPITGAGGDIEWYRLMKGTIAASGSPFIDPTTNQPTVFCLSGDPVVSSGWVDGMGGLSPQDRRMCLVSGPFTMAPGDTQEMVVALTAGIGVDRLSSITVLRSVDDRVQSAYNTMAGVGTVVGIAIHRNELPGTAELLQNFPNPFNPSTTIKYELPKSSMVKLSVYDILGREVSVLVNERVDAGVHEVKFDGSNLASGVYLYRLTSGSFTKTRKLVLMR